MNRINRSGKRVVLAAACALLILNSMGLHVSAGTSENGKNISEDKSGNIRAEDKSTDENYSPAGIRISIGENQNTPVFKAGEKASLNLSVANNGSSDARNVRISPDIDSEDGWPFELDQLNYEQKIGIIHSGETVSVLWGEKDGLKVKKNVTGKSYKLSFIITFDDGSKDYEINKYLFVKTEAQKNSGKEKADQPQSGSGGENGGEINNESENVIKQNYSEGTYFTNEPTAVSGGDVSGPGSSVSVPRVIVTGFTTDPVQVQAGTDFKLTVHLKNTSVKTAVSNMLFDFQAPASGTEAAAEAPAFLPSSGSSSVYVDKIDAGGTKDISIDLNARADLVRKPYSISLNMKYEDMSGGQYEAMSGLAIPVFQEARFELSGIQIAPDTVTAGEEVNVSCSLYNLGRIKMYNVKARMEGDGIETQEQFVGNVDSGSSGMIDCIIATLPDASGDNKCRLVLSFEDDSGTVKTSETEYEIHILPEMEIQESEYATEEPDENSLLPAIIVVAVLSAAAVSGIVIFKYKKKKRSKVSEEELFDEMERSAEDEH